MTSARVECRSCHAHVRARFGGAQDRQVMLTCLVCGRFDLFTSADLLPVARASAAAPSSSSTLDLTDAAASSAPAPAPATTADELRAAALLLAGRAQRSQR